MTTRPRHFQIDEIIAEVDTFTRRGLAYVKLPQELTTHREVIAGLCESLVGKDNAGIMNGSLLWLQYGTDWNAVEDQLAKLINAFLTEHKITRERRTSDDDTTTEKGAATPVCEVTFIVAPRRLMAA